MARARGEERGPGRRGRSNAEAVMVWLTAAECDELDRVDAALGPPATDQRTYADLIRVLIRTMSVVVRECAAHTHAGGE